MESLASEVWLLEGLTGSKPGMLTHENGTVVLQLVNDNDQLYESLRTPISAIADVKFPKLQMSGGCSFTVGDRKLRLSFLQPQNTRSPFADGAIQGVASIGGGRKAGKAWKALLGA